jgi:hypothetical protein
VTSDRGDTRQREIDQQHVGSKLLELGDGTLTVTGGPGNNYVRLVVE